METSHDISAHASRKPSLVDYWFARLDKTSLTSLTLEKKTEPAEVALRLHRTRRAVREAIRKAMGRD